MVHSSVHDYGISVSASVRRIKAGQLAVSAVSLRNSCILISSQKSISSVNIQTTDIGNHATATTRRPTAFFRRVKRKARCSGICIMAAIRMSSKRHCRNEQTLTAVGKEIETPRDRESPIRLYRPRPSSSVSPANMPTPRKFYTGGIISVAVSMHFFHES